MSGIGSLPYEDSLRLTTLQARRERGDMVETYKIITGKVDVQPSTWFSPLTSRDGAASTRATSGHLNLPGGKPAQKSERTSFQSELCLCGILYLTRSNRKTLSTILRMLMTTLRTNFPVQDVNTLDQMMGSFC